MDPLERLGWRVCADQLPPLARSSAVTRLEQALPGLRERGESRMLAHLLMCLSVHHLFRGEPQQARRLLDEAIAVPGGEHWPRTRIAVLQMEATWWMHHGDPARALEALLLMRRRSQEAGFTSFELKAELNLGYQLSALGDSALATEHLARARALAGTESRRLGEVEAAALVLAVERRDDAGARQAGERLTELCAAGPEAVDGRARALLRLFQAVLDAWQGRWPPARAAAEQARDDPHTGLAMDRSLVDYVHGLCCLGEGRHEAAAAHLAAARTQLSGALHRPRQALLDGLEARLLLAEGRAEAVLAMVERMPGTGARTVVGGGTMLQFIERTLELRDAARVEELYSDNEALRRLHQSEQQARAAAEAAAAARHRFLSTMSHEIRTPLNGVLASVDLLAESPLQPEQQRLVQVLRRSGELTLQILDDVLELGKIESGHGSIQWADFALREPLDQVVALHGAQAAARQIELEVHVHEGCPGRVRGDARRLEQVLLNLVANALRHTGPGRVQIRVAPAGAAGLRFEVQDDGEGIAPELLPGVFGAYVQGELRPGAARVGTGLGLAICQGLVTLHGGHIGVESTLGEGACFWFELPLEAAPPQPPDEPERPPSPLQGRRVLLAEDNPTNQALGVLMLEQQGAVVVAVDDGQAAVEAALADSYDLVLMDLHMPRMGGAEAARQLRRAGYAQPIVALTASALPEDRDAALAAGMDAFATKPVRPRQLLRVLSRLGPGWGG